MHVKRFMNARTFLALAVVVLLLPGNISAQETSVEFLTLNLAQGDENAEVTLLQEWLSTDSEIYPEQMVNGTFGPATEAAVRRYQERQGILLKDPSGESMYGITGPITRANLNAEFSVKRGGIAVVEAEYADASLWDGSSFVSLTNEDPIINTPVIARISTWVKPTALTSREDAIFTNGGGHTIGIEGEGKIYARSPKGKAVTLERVMRANAWQHVDVRFTDTSAIIYYDGAYLGTYALQPERRWTAFDVFLDKIAATFYGSFAYPIAYEFKSEAQQQEDPQVKEASGSFFGAVASFFRGLFGVSEPEAAPPVTVTEAPPVLVPDAEPEPEEEPVAIPLRPAATTTTTSPSIFAPPPVVTLPPTPATTTLVQVATTSTTTIAVATTTIAATSTESNTTDSKPSAGGGGSSSTNGARPVIELKGSEEVILDEGDTYSDPGASATDEEDGNLTKKIKVGGDKINYALVGDYEITYNVTDSDGNKAVTVSRIVRVTVPAQIPESQQQPRYPLSAAGEDVTYSVSGESGVDPRFVSVDIKPLHVYVGDTQTFTVKVSSESGVSAVNSETELDTSTLDLPLTLKSSSGGVDTYEASWVVHDTHVRTYITTFTAENGNGDENSITMAWSDPCAGITQGTNSSLSSNCSVSTVDGLDGANLTVPNGITLTLNSGATWAWNPGTTITVNGAIVKASGAQLRKGYLFYSGATNAAANTTSMVFNLSSSLTGHVRVNQYTQGSYYFESFYYSESFYCFAPDTRILMADGTEKAIKHVKLGDVVMGQNEYGVMKPNVVTKLYHHQYEENNMEEFKILRVNGHLQMTPEHPVFTQRGIVDAGDLRLGDTLTTTDGTVSISSIEEAPRIPQVYNLRVYPDHTYFANGIKVHNKGGDIP